MLLANSQQELFSAGLPRANRLPTMSCSYREWTCSCKMEAPMSLHPQVVYLVPKETARVARAAFPKGNVYMRMYDELGMLYENHQFAALFPRRGQPAEAPARLALILVMQFAENLTDRQAADAGRSRIDWKYALGLELTDAG